MIAENPQRAWRFYLDDMISFAENVIVYTDGHNQDSFVASKLNYDATLRNLELIGEAATHIPPEIREQTTQIPWRQVIATRNRLIHGYLGIDNDIPWSIVQEDIPALLMSTQALRNSLDAKESVK